MKKTRILLLTIARDVTLVVVVHAGYVLVNDAVARKKHHFYYNYDTQYDHLDKFQLLKNVQKASAMSFGKIEVTTESCGSCY